jgi:hypothetical protein
MLGQAMIEPEGLILLGMELEAAIEDATRGRSKNPQNKINYQWRCKSCKYHRRLALL